MATSSEVKAGLDDLAAIIRAERQALKSAKARITAAESILAAIPTQYADLIATITAFGTTNAFEALAKAELGKMNAEYQPLQTAATTAKTSLAGITEF